MICSSGATIRPGANCPAASSLAAPRSRASAPGSAASWRSAAASAPGSPGGTRTADPPSVRRWGGVSEVTIAHPAAAPWKTLFGTTRWALLPVPKMPRQTWWLATRAGSSPAGTQSSQRTALLAAAAAFAAAASWPSPIMVTSMGVPASWLSAAPMTGVPCRGVYRP